MERFTPLLAILAVLSVSPAKAQLNILSELSHDLDVQPGMSLDGTIDVENIGADPLTVRVYQTDYSFSADGTNAFDAPGSVARSNAGWVTFEPSVAVLEAGRELSIRYHILIPESLPEGPVEGSFWSMLMVEGQAGDQLAPTPEAGQVGMMQRTRYGIQIATHVGGGAPELEFSNGELEQTADGPVLKIDLSNLGSRMIWPGVTLRVVDGDGKEVSLDSKPKRIYPGTSVRHIIPLGKVPAGEYSAILIADGGNDNVFGASINLTL